MLKVLDHVGSVLGHVRSLDWVVVIVSTLALGFAAWAGMLTSNVLIALMLFVIGQWVIVMRHAWQEVHHEQAWLEGAGLVLTAVQTSLNRHLVSVSRNSDLELVTEVEPTWFTEPEYQERIRRLLDKLASEDFTLPDQTPHEPHPFKEGLVNLRDNIGPMRDLVRWGLTVERVYSAKNLERYSDRTMLLAILEMVLTHYLTDMEEMLQRVDEWPSIMPVAVQSTNVRFVSFKHEADKFRLVSRAYEIPQSAIRMARAFKKLDAPLQRLKLADRIPTLPVSASFQPGAQDEIGGDRSFCKDYLVLIWYRTVIVLLGEQLVATSPAS